MHLFCAKKKKEKEKFRTGDFSNAITPNLICAPRWLSGRALDSQAKDLRIEPGSGHKFNISLQEDDDSSDGGGSSGWEQDDEGSREEEGISVEMGKVKRFRHRRGEGRVRGRGSSESGD